MEVKADIKTLEDIRKFDESQDLVLVHFMVGNDYGTMVCGIAKGAPLYEAIWGKNAGVQIYNDNRGDSPEMIVANIVRLSN